MDKLKENSNNSAYNRAYKRVKVLRGFYTHLFIYVVINIAILVVIYKSLSDTSNFFEFGVFSTLIFWGVGLLAHALSVFLPNLILSSNWEEKKINEIMNKKDH